jgi:hypothetical protein
MALLMVVMVTTDGDSLDLFTAAIRKQSNNCEVENFHFIL